jgi:flagellin FlaB
VSRVKSYLAQRVFKFDDNAAIGIGSLIMFIAMIIVAGIAASVMIQTMNSLEEQAMKTGRETIRDVSSGLRVDQVTGYNDGSSITQLAIFVRTTAGSEEIDLSEAYISISDSSKKVILNYTTNVFSSTVSNGLFGTINSTNLSATTYGLMVVRDIDGSCTSTNPTINDDDIVVLMLNSTDCFSGIVTRTEVSGYIVPEYGMNGVFSFTTPSVYLDTIIELQT